jgi:pyruvate,water dikinase
MSILTKILHSFGPRDNAAEIRGRLKSFQALLEGNTRVLELIADAGEKLGGEYVFDIQYLKSLASDLEEAMQDVVYNLQGVTGHRYPVLVDRVWGIAEDVRAIVEKRLVVPKADLIIPLDQIDLELTEVVGDKMARLGDVKQHLGCRVPDGFVVSAHACQRFLEKAGIDPTSADNPPETPRDLRRRVAATPLPKELERKIRGAVKELVRRSGSDQLAVRSSALGEDGQNSFAGLYETVLGVTPDNAVNAYKQVVASLYGDNVVAYRRHNGLPPTQGLMPVGFLTMIPAHAAGVAYSLDPSSPETDVVVVSAARGLGKTVVEGSAQVDTFELSRRPPHEVLGCRIADKGTAYAVDPERGLQLVSIPDSERSTPAIAKPQLRELAATTLMIERYMKRAQDVEWTVDHAGRLHIVQVRPLEIPAAERPCPPMVQNVASRYTVLLDGRGTVACRGIGYGRVHIFDERAPADPPPQAVLVARTSTPRLAASLANASAVVTDVGTATGHLAAIAREVRVPTIVDAGNATELLKDGWEVTVDAEENVVYRGQVDELLRFHLTQDASFEERLEFRLLRRLLKRTAPLNLVDPQSPDFKAAACVTYHDVIRFGHEEAVRELINGRWLSAPHAGTAVRRLLLDIPLDLVLIDIGNGLDHTYGSRDARVQDIRCAPFRALTEGLLAKGVWPTGPADMDLDGFMASATRGGSLTGLAASRPQQNLAIVSDSYLHLSLKLGYHFNIVDCFLAEERNHNYIYFRFAGGVTELTRRSRRAVVLKRILESFDFITEGSGDLVVGRIKKIPRPAMVDRLRIIGRLIGFTRQLDILLRDDAMVDRTVMRFLKQVYDENARSSVWRQR